MAITDAYVYATNIAVALHGKTKSLKEAISDCDTDQRRMTVKSVIKSARMACDFSVSQNIFVVIIVWLFSKFSSSNTIMNQFSKSDKSNKDYLIHLDENQCSVKQQVAMRQEEEEKRAWLQEDSNKNSYIVSPLRVSYL